MKLIVYEKLLSIYHLSIILECHTVIVSLALRHLYIFNRGPPITSSHPTIVSFTSYHLYTFKMGLPIPIAMLKYSFYYKY